jgi:hypothetical protein
MKTLVITTIYGPIIRFFGVTRWYTRESPPSVHFERDGTWEWHPLERRHVGVYSE